MSMLEIFSNIFPWAFDEKVEIKGIKLGSF